jgi:hypothetical protein
MRIPQVLGFLLFFSSSAFVDPIYPPNAVSGGTVVAELHFVSGNVKEITIHSGEEPFVSSTKTALAQWHLHPEKDRNDLVIVHFRQPNLYNLNDVGENIEGSKPKESLPYPKYIVGPSYPAQTLGQGSAILRAEISADGSITEIQALKSAGSLTDVSIDAVRKWKFLPAEDDRGIGKPSFAYAVFVYRFPIIEQKR